MKYFVYTVAFCHKGDQFYHYESGLHVGDAAELYDQVQKTVDMNAHVVSCTEIDQAEYHRAKRETNL